MKISLNWYEQIIFLIALDAIWNGFLAYVRAEKRSIKALRWLDRKTASKKYGPPMMATACMMYGLVSVYGMFGAVRFIFKLRNQIKKGANNNGRRNRNTAGR